MPVPSTITIDGVEFIRKDTAAPTVSGDQAIFRCKNAGVHFGTLVHRKDGVVRIANSRRLWKWVSKATLSELAVGGPVKPAENRYGCVVPVLDLTESDVAEVIYTTPAAADGILAVPVWDAKP